MGLIGDFLELIGLGGITGVDILFAAMAIIGTILFIIYFLLVLIGDFTGGFLTLKWTLTESSTYSLYKDYSVSS